MDGDGQGGLALTSSSCERGSPKHELKLACGLADPWLENVGFVLESACWYRGFQKSRGIVSDQSVSFLAMIVVDGG